MAKATTGSKSLIKKSAAFYLTQLLGDVTATYAAAFGDVDVDVFELASAITAVASAGDGAVMPLLLKHGRAAFPNTVADTEFLYDAILHGRGTMFYGDLFVLLAGRKRESHPSLVWELLEIAEHVAPTLEVWVDPEIHGADTLASQVLNRATDGSAAYDVITPVDLVITHESKLVDLGFATAIPKGKAALLLPRSGLGAKHGMALANTVGLIDSDYRANWMAKLWLNASCAKTTLTIPAGERLCQFVLVDPAQARIAQVEGRADLGATDRKGGFGSSNLVMK